MVLDLTYFAYSHPGGAFLIDFNIGKDVGKFFYGGYAMDNNSNLPGDKNMAHTHSNIARKIANKHIIG
jgi:cytochrome b involved in lipid metabolism